MQVERDLSYLDLFSRQSGRELVPAKEPDLPVPAAEPQLPVATEVPEAPPAGDDDSPLAELRRDYDVRAISPRRMTELSTDLYANGILSWEEHSMLAFQPELQADYDRTIGALTGQPADPDRERNFVKEWEDRVAFEQRHNPGDNIGLKRSQHILEVLRQLASGGPTNLLV